MTTLRATKVYLAGTTVQGRRLQPTSCSLSASGADGSLDLAFNLGKGKKDGTEVVVAIGRSDLAHFIQEALALWPEMGPALAGKVAGTLADALEKQRTFQATVAKRTLKQLVEVDHALDALAEEDLPRHAMRKVFRAGDALEGARGTLEVF